MRDKEISSIINDIRTVQPDTFAAIQNQTEGIKRMVDIVNTETQHYNALTQMTKEKLVKGVDISHAQIMVLTYKYDLVSLQLQDIYKRLDKIGDLLSHMVDSK